MDVVAGGVDMENYAMRVDGDTCNLIGQWEEIMKQMREM